MAVVPVKTLRSSAVAVNVDNELSKTTEDLGKSSPSILKELTSRSPLILLLAAFT